MVKSTTKAGRLLTGVLWAPPLLLSSPQRSEEYGAKGTGRQSSWSFQDGSHNGHLFSSCSQREATQNAYVLSTACAR